MRVLMLSRTVPPQGRGGLAAAAADLAGAMAQAGAEVRMLTPALAPPPCIDGVSMEAVVALPDRYSPAWWKGSVQAFERMGAGRFDVVLGVSAAANALAARRRAGGPLFVFQAHGTSAGEVASKLRSRRSARAVAGAVRNLYWGLARDRAYRDYDAVVAVGEAVRRQLGAWPTRALVGQTPVWLIRNGVAAVAFRFDPQARRRLRGRLGLAEGAPLALFAGRLQADKGPFTALEAFARARRRTPGLALAIVGGGPEQARLRRQVAGLELGGQVHLSGHVPRAELADWLNAADALIFPTRRAEGLPLVVLEALACGLPVLTTPQGAGDPELPCARFAAHDVDGFAEALGGLSTGPGPRLPPAARLPSRPQRPGLSGPVRAPALCARAAGGCGLGGVRLTFVLEDLLTGGAQVHSVELALRLRRWEMQVQVMVLGARTAPALAERLGHGLVLLHQEGLSRPAEWRRLGEAIGAGQPDLVVGVNQVASCVAAVARARGDVRAPLAAVLHATAVRGAAGWMRTAPFFAAARTCDALVYVSERQQAHWAALGLGARRTGVIRNGVDLQRHLPVDAPARAAAKRALGLQPSDLTLGSVAMFRKEKNHRQLVRALDALRRAGVACALLLVGDGPTRGAVEALVAELDLGESVRFCGEQADVRPFLAAMDAGVLCSTAVETLPLFGLELMATGAPLVASRLGGLEELVEDGVDGLLFPPGDTAGLVRQLKRCADPVVRARPLGRRLAQGAGLLRRGHG